MHSLSAWRVALGDSSCRASAWNGDRSFLDINWAGPNGWAGHQSSTVDHVLFQKKRENPKKKIVCERMRVLVHARSVVQGTDPLDYESSFSHSCHPCQSGFNTQVSGAGGQRCLDLSGPKPS
ncbi:hypothetical protein J3458_012818 [Metarhizium acridum]|uniref:uncharacterized protein n=1 Tax=Metarhizium acridum TaxID=92637 RepID=UPI001C6BD0B3|nr:hypothetical protein J3458_012818 [Metarhizium acridum]